MPNWQNATDYAFIEKYRPELIAWEFLRRNPEYQQDYHWFITLWKELEIQYGAPPHRDFDGWKKDSRAYRSERDIYQLNENTSEVCVSPDDKLLIECWMGTKWGFYKFPVDPNKDKPVIDEDLSWRTTPVSIKLINEDSITDISTSDLDNKTAIIFDLQKDLKQQLQNAKQQLIIAQKNNLKFSQNKQIWILYLRLIDAIHENVTENVIRKQFKITEQEFMHLKHKSFSYMFEQYLDIINFL